MTLQRKTNTARCAVFTQSFVNSFPEPLEEGILYISVRYASAAHKCFCGCGREVVTPLHPTKWQLLFDGKTVSLHPSVGSWSLPCKSHYWLRTNQVIWAAKWSRKQIADGRRQNAALEDIYFGNSGAAADRARADRDGMARRLWRRLFG
jgi:hypothetical protein